MQDIYYTSADGKTTVHACLWRPENEIKGVVQIVHGMAEYAERYAPFAEYLTAAGYLVCAEDHLGHGKSVDGEDGFGYFIEGNGYETVLTDIRQLTQYVKERYSGVPYFIFGHSMGSFFTRNYIAAWGDELDGAVIMGTGYQPAIVTGFGKFLTRTVALFKGWRHRSKLITALAFGAYNKKFERRTYFDWLSSIPETVDEYKSDKLCGFMFTCSGYIGLFTALNAACKGKTFKATPADLPVYLVSGKCDPVGSYSKGVIKVYNKLEKRGVKDLSMTLYEGCRHEILRDTCAPQVKEDILAFFDAHCKN